MSISNNNSEACFTFWAATNSFSASFVSCDTVAFTTVSLANRGCGCFCWTLPRSLFALFLCWMKRISGWRICVSPFAVCVCCFLCFWFANLHAHRCPCGSYFNLLLLMWEPSLRALSAIPEEEKKDIAGAFDPSAAVYKSLCPEPFFLFRARCLSAGLWSWVLLADQRETTTDSLHEDDFGAFVLKPAFPTLMLIVKIVHPECEYRLNRLTRLTLSQVTQMRLMLPPNFLIRHVKNSEVSQMYHLRESLTLRLPYVNYVN